MDNIAIEAQPFGFCSDCLTAFLEGRKPVQAFVLSDGSRMVQAFCAERSVGGLLHVRQGKPQRWKLITPIDAVEWEKYVPVTLGVREGWIASQDDSKGKPLDS